MTRTDIARREHRRARGPYIQAIGGWGVDADCCFPCQIQRSAVNLRSTGGDERGSLSGNEWLPVADVAEELSTAVESPGLFAKKTIDQSALPA